MGRGTDQVRAIAVRLLAPSLNPLQSRPWGIVGSGRGESSNARGKNNPYRQILLRKIDCRGQIACGVLAVAPCSRHNGLA